MLRRVHVIRRRTSTVAMRARWRTAKAGGEENLGAACASLYLLENGLPWSQVAVQKDETSPRPRHEELGEGARDADLRDGPHHRDP